VRTHPTETATGMPKTLPPVALKSGKTALPPEYCIVLK
jgi:hypothetical protein